MTAPATPPETVDLSNCDREPIHIPGSVQPFGALVAVNSDWLISTFSANATEFLGLKEPLEPGAPLRDHFANGTIDALREALRSLADSNSIQRLFGISITGAADLFDVAIHLSGHLVIIELERHDAQVHAFSLNALRPVMARLEQVRGTEELCREATVALGELLGLSRVMVYKFHPDDSGEVIAEMIEPGQDSFLGLRYPASDIPRQARLLYLRNLLRIIGDVNAPNVPLVPATGLGGEAVDLSLSTLRSVSPIHLEYLRNMGVAASLSISIVVRGKLWGLFACHNYTPLILPFSLRTSAELFAQLFALLLDQRIGDASRALSDRGKAVHNRVMVQLADRGDLNDNLHLITEAIGPLVRHDGASAFIAGRYSCRGFAPSEEEFRAIVPLLNTAAANSVIAESELPSRIPQADTFADRATGALVIPVSRSPRDYVVLWRRPLAQTVTWAGNPDKPVTPGPHGDRLTPRKSFAAWKQVVEGKSEPWSEDEVDLAQMLRITLLEVLLRLADQANAERAASQQKQDLLIAELNHRVRNILTLIRGLIGQSRHDATDIESFANIIGGRIRALALAHDAITSEHWNPASLRQLINVESDAYLSGKTERVRISGPDVLILPEAYTVLALVIHELMTNSAKYGSLCDHTGRIEITLELEEFGDLSICWREVGGPPVRPPQRRGFGSTIIERSIPYELKGTVELDYRLDGLVGRFNIPARFVLPAGGGISAGRRSAIRPAPSGAPANRQLSRVLVVEDNIIIAMDTEEFLRDLGIAEVVTASSVRAADEAMARDRFDLAILDFNLGNENSIELAERLSASGVPLAFATGYGDAISSIATVPHLAVLKKPYSSSDLAGLLALASSAE